MVAVWCAAPVAAADWLDARLWDVAFSSIDVEARSTFLSTGSKKSVDLPTLGARGFVLGASGLSLSDVRRARLSKLPASDIDRQSRLVVGLERSTGPVFASVGVGPAMATVRRTGQRGRQTAGIALNADIWIRPDPTLYLALSLAADSASGTLWSRARLGYKPEGWALAIGPELAASADRTSGKVKAGIAISEFGVWKLGFQLSAGQMWDSHFRPGRYLSAGMTMAY